MFSKSRRSLKAARNHLAEAEFDFAASRAYYAAFYAMEAALLTKGENAGYGRCRTSLQAP